MAAPTTAEINQNIIAQLESNLNQTIPLLPRAFNRVISKALAAVFVILYKYAGYNMLQQFVKYASYAPTTANGVTFVPLIEWGRLIGVGDPIAATYAEFEVVIPVTGSGSITEGTLFRATENGYTYAASSSVTYTAGDGAVNVPVIATTAPGNAGNVSAGSSVVLAQPTAGVDPNGTRGTETVTAQDVESEEDYRRRVELRFSQRPQGGSLIDYLAWGEDAGDVRCYPYKSTTFEGVVETYVRALSAPDGVPTPAQLEAVLNYQNSSSGLASGVNDRKPANAYTTVTSILSQAYTVQVVGLTGTSNPAEATSAVISAVEAYFNELAPYIVGINTGTRTDLVSYFGLIGIVQTVVAQFNGAFTSLTLERNGSPVVNEYLPRGTFATVTVTVA